MPKTAKHSQVDTSKADLENSALAILAQAPLLPADSEDSALTILLKQYLKPQDVTLVREAYRFAFAAHDGVVRKTGESYITHPVSVACILADLNKRAHSVSVDLP